MGEGSRTRLRFVEILDTSPQCWTTVTGLQLGDKQPLPGITVLGSRYRAWKWARLCRGALLEHAHGYVGEGKWDDRKTCRICCLHTIQNDICSVFHTRVDHASGDTSQPQDVLTSKDRLDPIHGTIRGFTLQRRSHLAQDRSHFRQPRESTLEGEDVCKWVAVSLSTHYG